MPNEQQQTANGLRARIAQAIQAYELARAIHVRELAVASAEQKRGSDLLAHIEQVDRAARDLLGKAGLAHIAGAPLRLDETAAPIRRGDEAVAAAFAAAQTAGVDLRVALLQLGQQFLESQRWEETRRILQPLLEDQKVPLYADAHALLCETHYRPAAMALEAQEWDAARQGFEIVLQADPAHRDAAALYREAYLRPAGLALEAGQWDDARRQAELWLGKHQDDEGAQWVVRETYLRSARQALEAGQWDWARQHAEGWLKEKADDADAREVVSESFYQQALAAVQAGEWQVAYQAFAIVLQASGAYRDAADRQQQVIHRWLDLDLVKIPAGSFLYGDNKQPTHLDEFWISRTPVTNAQYQLFVKATGYTAPSHWSGGAPPTGKEQHPVVNVSWNDAQAFCRWAGVSLPGERQWEKAARGTDGRQYPWGETEPNGQRCNLYFTPNEYFFYAVGDTTEVEAYPEGASPYGLLDMVGNIWEWCADECEHGRRRVLRGGVLHLASEDYVRCALRFFNSPGECKNFIGFRVVTFSL